MGSRKEKEAIVILLDVGVNMRQLSDIKKTYLESSKECVSQIIQRKLHSKSIDEVALILFGCEKTDNKLAKQLGGYTNIHVVSDHLTQASWDILRFINRVDVSNATADWLDAIMVAVDFIKDETEIRQFNHHKIVIFSNFDNFVSDDKIDWVIGAINDMKINLVVIGPDVQNSHCLKKSKAQTDGEILISNIVDKVEGSVICTFEDALAELMYVQRKSVKPTPWNALFTISSKIKIPISAYKKIAEIPPMKWTAEVVDDQNAGVVRASGYMKYDGKQDREVEVERGETVKGYQFGSTIIPFGESEEEMGYKSGAKGLYLIGCTQRERVPLHLLMGTGCYIIVPKSGDDVADVALNAFIEGLSEHNAVGIARRVYNFNTAALIGALFPVINEEHRYLVFVELPFAEDEHVYKFPSLSDVNPSKEQLDAIENLIDAANLDETEEHAERYELTRIYDPREQHVLRCITEKALNPESNLNKELFNKDVLIPQPEIIRSCEFILKEIKELFPLTTVEPKKKKLKGALASDSKEMNGDLKTNGLFPQTSTIKIDPANPAEEFLSLLRDGKPFDQVCEQMENVIEKLVSASDDPHKVIECLKVFREGCFKNVEPYNTCITKVKNIIADSNISGLWELIQNNNLGLICKSEVEESDITSEAAQHFLTLPKKEEIFHEDVDVDAGASMDLLDEL